MKNEDQPITIAVDMVCRPKSNMRVLFKVVRKMRRRLFILRVTPFWVLWLFSSKLDSICYHLGQGVRGKEEDILSDILRRLFKLWPEFSGNTNYPISAPKEIQMTASQYYLNATAWGRLWRGEYGKSRKRLVKFLYQKMKQPLIFEPTLPRPPYE